ncbi:MAG: flagellar export chaperone FlgN [Nitrospirae bacterium]|nr:flagellar export chaperone FlgN [Nitrospirota bacterium]
MPRQHESPNGSCSIDTLDHHWVNLLDILEELIGAHQQLLPILQTEKRLIVEQDFNDLLPCLAEKDGMLGRLRDVERRRREVVGTLGSWLGQSLDALTLTRIATLAPVSYASRFRSCQARLESLTASMIEINQINGILVDRILMQVTNLIGLLRHLVVGAPTYQASGMLQDGLPGGRTLGTG